MIKRHKKASTPLMRRACRVYLNNVNAGKLETLTQFLGLCHDIQQYFVDLFWQRQDFTATLADLATIHRGRDRFGITTRLAQALAKQAKESVRSQLERPRKRKPRLRRHGVTLYSHFVTIEPFVGHEFDWAVKFVGSGAPKNLTIPVKSTALINQRQGDGWKLSKTIRLGRDNNRLWIDFLLEKPRPATRVTGSIIGIDSNYKAGLVFSDGQQVGEQIYYRIVSFAKRQKHTQQEIKSSIGQAIKTIDWSDIKAIAIEDLKCVKSNKRGTFSRQFNRRLSHWTYRYFAALIERHCEELGVEVLRKHPAYTSQYCRQCRKWDRRNCKSDRFLCVNCGHADHADFNASKNLELLGLAGAYGIRSLSSS